MASLGARLLVQGDLRSSSLRAGWASLSSPHLGPRSGQKRTELGTGWPGVDPVPGGQEQGGGGRQASRPPQAPGGCLGLPRAPLGTGCLAWEGCCPEAPLSWAGLKIAGGWQGRDSGGRPAGRGRRGEDSSPGRGGSQWRWRTHPVPGGRPAEAQLTRYFFPCLTKYGQGAQPKGAPWPGRVFGMLGRVYKDCKGEAGS